MLSQLVEADLEAAYWSSPQTHRGRRLTRLRVRGATSSLGQAPRPAPLPRPPPGGLRDRGRIQSQQRDDARRAELASAAGGELLEGQRYDAPEDDMSSPVEAEGFIALPDPWGKAHPEELPHLGHEVDSSFPVRYDVTRGDAMWSSVAMTRV